ncbi:MAG: hypothetical protein HOI86_01535 [Tateyamaria sp.]|jgi:hypothetical protein|nr:hypothetical protein [Tateyamaria sp.]MBT5301806.1 hypothetical protein [Tateyamaria sp.]MBT6266351.1 hypothetical protein [Tateyamaria sp.]MBT6344523.1 hypothetical protein [Tateyamaria sp.]MBT7446780.1 hypothetical protein [Tateyamaria sp.]
MKIIQSLAAITAISFATSAIAEDNKPVEWLFVHTAPIAELTSDTTLVMPVTRDIFAFTDRPNRKHGYMNAHEWVSAWDEGDTFKTDPPNAVVTWMDGDDVKEAEIIITDATVENYGRTIAYEVKGEIGDLFNGQQAGASLFVDGRGGCGSALFGAGCDQ